MSIFERFSHSKHTSSDLESKRRRVEFDPSDPDRFFRQGMELSTAYSKSCPRSPSEPFRHIWNLSLQDIQGSPNFPSQVFVVIPSQAPPNGFPAPLHDENEILLYDPWVFELLDIDCPRGSEEIFLSLKTRLVGSKDQVFPGPELEYFNLAIDKGTVPPRLWILTERGIQFAEQSHDMTATAGFHHTSAGRTFSYLQALDAKADTPEYYSAHPYSAGALRYHTSIARPSRMLPQRDIFSFVGAEDFRRAQASGRNNSRAPFMNFTHQHPRSSSSSSERDTSRFSSTSSERPSWQQDPMPMELSHQQARPLMASSSRFAGTKPPSLDQAREMWSRPQLGESSSSSSKSSTLFKQHSDSSASDSDSSEEEKGRCKEKFATDRYNGQSLPMKLQMNTNLSELFSNFALSRFLRNNGDPDLLAFVLDHKLAPLEKTQFVAGVKAFLHQKQGLLERPVLLQKLLGLTVVIEPDLLYLFCTDCFRLTTQTSHEVDDNKMMLAYCLPPSAFHYGKDDARTAFNVNQHKNVPQWTSALAKLSEAVTNLGELFTALLKPNFLRLWAPIYRKIEQLNSSDNSNRNTEFIAYELQYRLAQFVEHNHTVRTTAAWTPEQVSSFFNMHVIRTFLVPEFNHSLIQELQFRQQRSAYNPLSLFPSASTAVAVKAEGAVTAGGATKEKKEKRGRQAKKQKVQSTSTKPVMYTEEEAKAKFGDPKSSEKASRGQTTAQPRASTPVVSAHPKGTQYCRHYLLQQLGVKNLETKEVYSCARGSCRPGNHSLVTVDSTSTKRSILEFLALQISLDSFSGAKAEVAKKHLDAHVAALH